MDTTSLSWTAVIAAAFSAVAAIGSCVAAYKTYQYNLDKDKRYTADRISIWTKPVALTHDKVVLVIQNLAQSSIRDVFIIGCPNNVDIMTLQNWFKAPFICCKNVIPGEWETLMNDIPHGMNKYMVLTMFFRDSHNQEWMMNNSGSLELYKDYKKLLTERHIYAPYPYSLLKKSKI